MDKNKWDIVEKQQYGAVNAGVSQEEWIKPKSDKVVLYHLKKDISTVLRAEAKNQIKESRSAQRKEIFRFTYCEKSAIILLRGKRK